MNIKESPPHDLQTYFAIDIYLDIKGSSPRELRAYMGIDARDVWISMSRFPVSCKHIMPYTQMCLFGDEIIPCALKDDFS